MRSLKLLFLRVCRSLGFFALANYCTRHKLLILCYHGFEIQDESLFRPDLFISQQRFRRRLKLLSNHRMCVLPLADALEKMYRKELPHNTVSITMDDGWSGVYSVATPILSTLRLPATVYVNTYNMIKDTPVFRLVVQYIFWKTELDVADMSRFTWVESESVNLADDAAVDRCLWACIHYGESLGTEPSRQELLDELGVILNVDVESIRRTRKLSLLTVKEIQELDENGIDIQLHTHRHRFPIDDIETCKREIRENREVLTRALGKRSEHFCYPSGIWHERQFPWLESLEIKSATTCDPGFNDFHTNKFSLKRILDSESVTDTEFLAEITGFSSQIRRLRDTIRIVFSRKEHTR